MFALHRVLAVLIALGALVLPGSVQGGLFDDEEARRQIGVERKRVDDLANRLESSGQAISAVNARIGKLEESLKSQALLDLFKEIESLKGEMAKLRGHIEVLNNAIENTQKRQRDLYVDLDTRMRRLESAPPAPATAPGAAVPATPQTAGPVPAGAPATPAAASGESPEARSYDAAQQLRRIGNYQAAIISFQNFVKQYPKSPLASSAQYWIGDSYFNLRDYRLAVAAQRTLLGAYPDSQKVPDALLNIASSQIEMGESAAARKTMEEIVAKYPVSEAADKAKRRLATLK